jgi:hypothetical protein
MTDPRDISVGGKIDRVDGLAPRLDGPRSERSTLVVQTVPARRVSWGSEFLATVVG